MLAAWAAAAPGEARLPQSAEANGIPKLAWAPPQLTSPVVVNVPGEAPVVLKLDPNRDYILRLEHLQGPGGLVVHGGRNVVLIGGEITPLTDDVESHGYALRFYDQTGTVHLEGLLIDGASDGITIEAPQAIFQIENVRIENLHALRDDFSYAHPDLIQTWSGPREVRIDRFTGQSDYQGFTWMKDANAPSYVARVVQQDVNIAALMPQAGTVLRWPDGSVMNKPSLGAGVWHVARETIFSCRNCWLATGWYSQRYRRTLQDSIGGWMNPDGSYSAPPYRLSGKRGPNLGRQQGDLIVWPGVPSLEAEAWHMGRPPGLDFVPAGTVGAGYVSPGYESKTQR